MRSTPVLCGLAAWLSADLAAARPNLCTAGEVPVFSCATTGGKVVSLCASPDLSETAGSLRYRFGRPGEVELTYPDDQTPPKAAFRAGTIGAGRGDFVRFTKSDVTYTIEHADGPRSGQYAGVTIHRGPKRVAALHCTRTPYDALGSDGFAPIYRAKLPSEPYGLE
jgi:hypothetical protein